MRSYDSTEIVAGNVLGATVIFLLLQVLVMVVFMVFTLLLPGLGVLSPEAGGRLGIVSGLLAEVILVVSLVRMVRRRIGKQPVRPPAMDATADSPEFERALERLMLLAALLGIVCSLLLGLGPKGAKVALTVIEAFTALFLLIAVATRWFMTRRVSTVALVALGATVISLGLATGFLRR